MDLKINNAALLELEMYDYKLEDVVNLALYRMRSFHIPMHRRLEDKAGCVKCWLLTKKDKSFSRFAIPGETTTTKEGLIEPLEITDKVIKFLYNRGIYVVDLKRVPPGLLYRCRAYLNR